MRFLHVYSGNLWGGIEAMLATIARLSQRAGEDVHEFALSFQGRLSDELRIANALVHDLGAVRVRYPWTVLRARRRLGKLLARGEFDAVIFHAAWSFALFGSVGRPLRTRDLFWMHDIASGTHWTERLAKRRPPSSILYGNSNFTSATAGLLWRGARATTVHYPVEPVAVELLAQRDAVRSEMHCDPSTVVVIQVGRLEEWKGHLTLLDALALVRDLPQWEYWIVGGAQRPAETTYLSRLQERAKEIGISERTRFFGQRSDVGRLLGAADIFCQPNLRPEPYGIAIVEALSAGLPVLATEPGGASEIVDARCGVLVRANDPVTMAGELRRLIADAELRRVLGEGAVQRAAELAELSSALGMLRESVRSLVAP